jgi:hypothetical protein
LTGEICQCVSHITVRVIGVAHNDAEASPVGLHLPRFRRFVYCEPKTSTSPAPPIAEQSRSFIFCFPWFIDPSPIARAQL